MAWGSVKFDGKLTDESQLRQSRSERLFGLFRILNYAAVSLDLLI